MLDSQQVEPELCVSFMYNFDSHYYDIASSYINITYNNKSPK